MDVSDKISKFESLLLSTNRQGIENVVKWIREKTDFYTAPASANYHSNYDGGLLEHCLCVYDAMVSLSTLYENLNPHKAPIPKDSLIICALLHDLCKVNTYHKQFKFYKKEGETEWSQYPSYELKETFPIGHATKSLFILQQLIKLTKDEAIAINHHMGLLSAQNMTSSADKFVFIQAMREYPLAAVMCCADTFASFALEDVIDYKK